MTSKLEERAIRNVLTTYFDELCTRVKLADPLSFGKKLVAKFIVGSEKFESIKHYEGPRFASELVLAAKPLLEFEPEKFKIFLLLLLEDVASCRPLGEKICNDMVRGKLIYSTVYTNTRFLHSDRLFKHLNQAMCIRKCVTFLLGFTEGLGEYSNILENFREGEFWTLRFYHISPRLRVALGAGDAFAYSTSVALYF